LKANSAVIEQESFKRIDIKRVAEDTSKSS